jgi:WD40 repeat protein
LPTPAERGSIESASGQESASSIIGAVDVDLGDDELQHQDDDDDHLDDDRKPNSIDGQLKHLRTTIAVPSRDTQLPPSVRITETDTFWVLDKPSLAVPVSSADPSGCPAVIERYEEALQPYKSSDVFAESSAQTMSSFPKNKEVQANTPPQCESEAQVNVWDIHDRLLDNDDEAADGLPRESTVFSTRGSSYHRNSSHSSSSHSQSFAATTQEQSHNDTPRMSAISAFHDTSAVSQPTAHREDDGAPDAMRGIRGLVNLPRGLEVAEKAVAQNSNHSNLLLYNGFRSHDAVRLLPQDRKQHLQHLFDFSSSPTEGRNVTCMAWNKAKPEILVVGYGQLDFAEQADGMVAVWSVKTPHHPKSHFRTSFGVTAIDFSELNPSLFGVGFYNGTLAVYDTRIGTNEPLLESEHSGGQHSDPVWQLRWIKQSDDQSESMVSISTDGRVTSWSVRKGLEPMDLMELKRDSKTGGSKDEAFISRRSGGMCFDFHPQDGSLYLAGTEDGSVHKCSSSHREQYLQSYSAHSAPVYSARWSPYNPRLFLTASADWTVTLWDEEYKAPLVTFQSGNEEVTDMSWSPAASTVFAATSQDGRVDVWDMSTSTLHPAASGCSATAHDSYAARANCLLFGESSPVLLVGDSSSRVHVYRLMGFHEPNSTVSEQVQRLEDALGRNALSGSGSAGY